MMSFIISHVKVPIIQICFPLYGKWVMFYSKGHQHCFLCQQVEICIICFNACFLIWTIRNLISLLKLEDSMFYQIWSVYQVSFISKNSSEVFFFCTSKLSFFSLYWSDCIFSLSPSSSSINSPSDYFILYCIPSIQFILTSFKWIHFRFKKYLWRRHLIYFLGIYTF